MASLAETHAYTADKHKAAGLQCADCHGDAPKSNINQTACLKCHDSMQAVAKRTADMSPNPHDNHRASVTACLQCHHGHKRDEVSCTECHFDVELKRNK
jgi:hypothetical protein